MDNVNGNSLVVLSIDRYFIIRCQGTIYVLQWTQYTCAVTME